MKERGNVIAGLIIGAFIVIVVLIIIFIVQESAKRNEWLSAHCKEIGEVSGSVGVGYATNAKGGLVTTYTPGKTGYQCDDGKQYWE